MKKLLSLAMILAICIPAANAASVMRKTVKACGTSITETRKTGHFRNIVSCCGIRVLVYVSDKCGVEIEADKNIAPYLITEVNDNTLMLYYDDDVNIKNNGSTTVKVYCSELEEIRTTSGSTISFETPFSGRNITIAATSASSVRGEINYGNCNVLTTSGAEVRLRGQCDTYTVASTSGSSVNLGRLAGRNVEATATSGATVSVYATESVTAAASSGATIRYYGSPRNTNITKSSGGRVTAK